MSVSDRIDKNTLIKAVYIFLTLICLLPDILYVFFSSTLADSLVKKLFYIIIFSALFILPFIFFKAKTIFLIYGIGVILSPLEIVHLYLNKAGISSGFILLIAQTDIKETFEIVTSFSVFVVLYVIELFLYFFLVIKFVENKVLFSKRIKLYLGAISILILSGLYLYGFGLGFWITRDFKRSLDFSTTTYMQKFEKIYPFDFMLATRLAIETNAKINSMTEELQKFSFDAKTRNNSGQREIYVLVIGETARYSSFSVNGYRRKTSPLLEKTQGLTSFHNVYSEANFTEASLPILLTRSTARNFEVFRSEKSVLEAFNEAGFKTYWIANQSFSNPFIRRIILQTSQSYLTTRDYDSANNYDASMYDYLDQVLKKNEKKQFIVIHSLGSHFRYNFRYPEDFRQFRPDFTGAFDYGTLVKKNKDKLINTYDNSILYTDYFLSGIITKLQQSSCVSFMYYISDHGENLFEGNSVLHGGIKPTTYDVHVPLFVWTSDKYNKIFPDKKQNIEHNIYKRLSSSVTFHSLLDMANIVYPGENRSKSLASPELKSESLRYMLNPDMNLITFK
jgi:glucan phosphoethanolaminetransferase (alkaline phosphatase superfamily)